MNNEIVKPENSSEIHTQHSHGSDMPRVEMLKSYNSLKIVAQDSESSTRDLLANSVQIMSAESVGKTPETRICQKNDTKLQKNSRRICWRSFLSCGCDHSKFSQSDSQGR